MYLHSKHGFVEADRWDGQEVPVAEHQRLINRLLRKSAAVIVVRSRDRDTLVQLTGRDRGRDRRVFTSPPGWDYEFRAYLTVDEWAQVLARVAFDLDYRNFKRWTGANRPGDHRLAHDIWHAAFEDGARRRPGRAA